MNNINKLILLSIIILIINLYIIKYYNNYKRTVYIISNVESGGAIKYLNDITIHYTNNKYIYSRYI